MVSDWRLGEGRGRALTINRDWSHKPGVRGGGAGSGHGPLHARSEVLQQVFMKYYGQRLVH